jgi:hypothetical protein
VLCNGLAERGEHDRAGDPVVGRDEEGVAGAVVEPGQDLAVRAGSPVGAGEAVVGEVGLPGLVGHRCLKPDVGRLGLLLRLRDDQAVRVQVSGDRGPADAEVVVMLQVPADGLGASVEPGGGELLAELEDQFHDVGRDRVRDGLGSARAGLEDRLALGAVAGEQLVEPGARDAVLGGDVGNGSVLDHNSGDHQSGFRHGREPRAAATPSPGCRETSVRHVLGHASGMS